MKLYNLLIQLNESKKYYDLIDKEINEIVKLIRMGYQSEYIKKIHKNNFDFLYEFARARIKIAGKFSMHDHLFMDYYSSMYSTPEIVGKYRSKKLAENKIIDAGSGSGMQDIMLSEFSTVTGIEIDANRCAMANLNKIPYNSNVNFINSDIFSFNGNLSGHILFSDPLRPVNSKEKLFSQLIPDPLEILRRKPEIAGYAIDLPPHMEWNNIPLKGEKEYISINGILNRLTLYSPSISEKISTAVILPENIVITGEPEEYKNPTEYSGKIDSYLYIPDISITYAKLLHRVIKQEWKAVYIDERRQVFSGKSYEDGFPGKQYSILASSSDLKNIPLLRNIDAGKVFFRFKMKPEETYMYKNSIERELTGSKNIYIFKSMKKYILAEEID